jgi:hypothetical protein
MSHRRRMHFWILASALLAVGACGRQNHDKGLVRLSVTRGASLQALIGGSVEAAASDYLTQLNVPSQGQPVREFVLLQKVPGLVAVVSPKTLQQIREVLPESGPSPDAESDFDAIDVAKAELALDGRMTPGAHNAAVRFLTGPDATKLKSQEPYTNEFLRE